MSRYGPKWTAFVLRLTSPTTLFWRLALKEVKAMANVVRNSTMKFNLDGLTDEELDTIINNTHAQLAQMQRFLNQVSGERTRRVLGLPTTEQDESSAT